MCVCVGRGVCVCVRVCVWGGGGGWGGGGSSRVLDRLNYCEWLNSAVNLVVFIAKNAIL